MLHKIYGWGRVGWDDNFFWPCTHGRLVDATQDLRLGSGGVGWDDNVLWP